MDHNDKASDFAPNCRSFAGLPFPACYAGHSGTDFMAAGSFPMMDAGSFDVLTAAPGIVVRVQDGFADRCYFDPRVKEKEKITCPNNPGRDPNYVAIRQDDGLIAYYFHLKRSSIRVHENDRVECGQFLAKVGSAGISANPHLHFELREIRGKPPAELSKYSWKAANSRAVDPYDPGASLWAKLKGLHPQLTCGDAKAAACRQEKSRLSCDNRHQRVFCEALDALQHATCALMVGTKCALRCSDFCKKIEGAVRCP